MIVLGVLAFAAVVLTIPVGRAPIWEPNNAVEIDSGEWQRLLAEPARDVVILTRKRWAEAQAHTASAGWQVLESRTVGARTSS